MNTIAHRTIKAFAAQHTNPADALEAWYTMADGARWENLNDVRADCPSADQVGQCLVFNIKGNHYRLIVGVVYANKWANGTLYIEHFLTHAEYDKDAWKADCCE